MARRDDDESSRMLEEIRQRQRRPIAPKPIGDVVNRLLARRGYAQQQASQQWQQVWGAAVGDRLVRQSRVGQMRNGVLEVTAKNSIVLQELTLQKRSILTQLSKLVPGERVDDLRFRVGEID